MKNKLNIKVVNWLLTRACNLKCSYCGIIDKYVSPRSAMEVIADIDLLHTLYEPFHIFYGGEPLMYDGLAGIVKHCNIKNIPYTIITNNSDGIQNRLKKLFEDVGYIQGLTSSVDPLIFADDIMVDEDRREKSRKGLLRLMKLSVEDKIKDLVAEITVDNNNIDYLIPLVRQLTRYNISSSVTFIDIKKNKYYDFSNVTDKSLLVENTQKIKDIFDQMFEEGLDIHMGRKLTEITQKALPANYDCKFEECLHNLTVDADGSLRLCLRIDGEKVKDLTVRKLLVKPEENLKYFYKDKKSLCEKCNWTCVIMSQLAIDGFEDELKHTEKRNVGDENA